VVAYVGYCEIVELLLGFSTSLDARNKTQETPLSYVNGKPDMVHFLIDRGSDINSRDKNGSTLRHDMDMLTSHGYC
jgi:ankyrin repeat protein